MEVGPRVEFMEAAAEQPDFLEIYANKEVTVFGITGKLQDLAGMCPIDLSDPRITPDVKNEFVVKVANESGMEIAPEHEGYFTQVIEKHGHERKFAVTPPEQNDTTAAQPTVKREKAEAPQKTTPPTHEHTQEPDATKHDIAPPVAPETLQHEKSTTTALEVIIAAKEAVADTIGPLAVVAELGAKASTHASKEIEPAATVSAEIPAIAPEQIARLYVMEAYESLERPHLIHPLPDTAENSLELQFPANAPADRTDQPERIAFDNPLSEVDTAALIEAIIHGDAELEPANPALAKIQLASTPLSEQYDYSTEPGTWQDALAKEPLDFYDDFVEALSSLPELELFDASEGMSPEIEPTLTEQEAHAAARPEQPSFSHIVEHLHKITDEEKEVAAPILHKVVVLAQSLTAEVAPEQLETGMIQLREHIAALFEALDITCEPENIEHFIRILLSPDFRPPHHEAPGTLIDLEHEGTHEAKWRFPQHTNSNLVYIQSGAMRLLGKLVLFHSSGNSQTALATP